MTKRERARAARAMVKVMRVAGDEEGEDGKAMVMATRMAGKWTVMARKRAMVMATRMAGKQRLRQQNRAMAMATGMVRVKMVMGDKEGNGDSGKSDGYGNKSG